MQFVCWVLLWWLLLWATCPVSGLPPSDLCGRLMWIFMGYFLLVYQLLCCWYILGREISNSLFTNVTNACLSHLTCRHFLQISLGVILSSLCSYKHFCHHHYLCSFAKQNIIQWTKKPNWRYTVGLRILWKQVIQMVSFKHRLICITKTPRCCVFIIW